MGLVDLINIYSKFNIYLLICSSICGFIYKSFHVFYYLSFVYLYINLSIDLSINLLIYHLSNNRFVYLSIYLFIYLSINLLIYLADGVRGGELGRFPTRPPFFTGVSPFILSDITLNRVQILILRSPIQIKS